MVTAFLVQLDSTHELVEQIYKKVPKEGESDWHVAELRKAKKTLETMRSDYLYLLSNRDYILKVAEIYAAQSKQEKDEIEDLNRTLKYAQEALSETQFSLQRAENQIKLMEHFQEHENRVRQEFFQDVIDELESIQQIYDLDSCPKWLSSKTSKHFQLVDNPLFEVVADWTIQQSSFCVR